MIADTRVLAPRAERDDPHDRERAERYQQQMRPAQQVRDVARSVLGRSPDNRDHDYADEEQGATDDEHVENDVMSVTAALRRQ
jgi:hypothetical protein